MNKSLIYAAWLLGENRLSHDEIKGGPLASDTWPSCPAAQQAEQNS